jgi:hypothetical protein
MSVTRHTVFKNNAGLSVRLIDMYKHIWKDWNLSIMFITDTCAFNPI